MTVIETERLLLRHLVPSDREALLDLVSRWEVVRNLARWPYPAEPQMVDDLIARHAEPLTGGFGIELGGRIVGLIGASASVGFMVHPDVWGRGVMSEALAAVQDHCLDDLGFEAIAGNVLIDNPASARVFEKCGWREVGSDTCFSKARGEALADRVFVYARRYDWLDPIETERLVLRPLGPQDFEAIWPIVSDEGVVRMLKSWPWPADEEYTRNRLNHALAWGGLVSAVVRKGAVIGMIGCVGGSLWYALAREAWGQGYATEAARAKIANAFADPSVMRLTAGTWDDNPASDRILTRLGFVQTGRETMFHQARGEEVGGPVYELTRQAWDALH